jgi:hypothetical protein
MLLARRPGFDFWQEQLFITVTSTLPEPTESSLQQMAGEDGRCVKPIILLNLIARLRLIKHRDRLHSVMYNIVMGGFIICVYYKIILMKMSRDSSVGIATGYGLEDQGGGSSSPGRVNIFCFSISSRPALGSTQRPIKWVPGVKRQGLQADHSPPTSAEVKKMWIHTSTPPYVFMV